MIQGSQKNILWRLWALVGNESCLESFLLINCNHSINRLANIIRNIAKVENVDTTTGTYEIVTKIKTKNYSELQKVINNDFVKLVGKNSVTVLTKKDNGIHLAKINDFNLINNDCKPYTLCDYCGLELPYCTCKCPFCGERDKCECACGEAATGG